MQTRESTEGHLQPQPSLGMPPAMPQRPSGVARAIAFAHGLSGKAFVLAIVVLVMQGFMPPGGKPSDLIGGFHGATETAEMNAKRDAQAQYELAIANARAAGAAQWQMEQQVSQVQQQNRAEALQSQQTVANIADFGCIASGLVESWLGRNDPMTQAAKSGCGVGDKLRDNMTASLAATARQGSGLMQRPTPVVDQQRPVETAQLPRTAAPAEPSLQQAPYTSSNPGDPWLQPPNAPATRFVRPVHAAAPQK